MDTVDLCKGRKLCCPEDPYRQGCRQAERKAEKQDARKQARKRARKRARKQARKEGGERERNLQEADRRLRGA